MEGHCHENSATVAKFNEVSSTCEPVDESCFDGNSEPAKTPDTSSDRRPDSSPTLMGDGPYIANSPKVDAEVKEPKQKVIDTRPLYKCDECGHITRSLGGLEIHSKYHIHKSKFSCQFCTFSAAVKYKIDLHVKRCHSDMHNQKVAGSFKTKSKLLKCNWCDFSAISSVSLTTHQSRHNFEGKYRCHLCVFSSARKAGISWHINRCHSNENDVSTATVKNPDQEGGSSRSQFSCDRCAFSTDSSSLWKNHLREHVKGASYRCETCGFSASEKELIDIHSKDCKINTAREETEQMESVLCCPECPYWCRHPSIFHDHFLRHQPFPIYKCSGCDVRRRCRQSINSHIDQEKKVDEHHRSAEIILTEPIPEDRYATFRRMMTVNKTDNSGWTNHSRAAKRGSAVLQEEASQDVSRSSDSPGSPPAETEPFSKSEPPLKQKEDPLMIIPDDLHTCDWDEEETKCCRKIRQIEKDLEAAQRMLHCERKEVDHPTNATAAVNQEKLESLKKRVEVMNGKVEAADEDLQNLVEKKVEVEKKLKIVTGKKMRAEIAVRTLQSNILKLRLKLFESEQNNTVGVMVKEAEEKLKQFEADEKLAEADLEELKQEAENLDEELEEAQESRNGAFQVHRILLAELKQLEPASPSPQDRENHQSDRIKLEVREKLRSYVRLEERRARITYMSIIAKAHKKEKNLLETFGIDQPE